MKTKIALIALAACAALIGQAAATNLNAATAAPFASAALDALTGAAPALGEAVQTESHVSHESSRIDTNLNS